MNKKLRHLPLMLKTLFLIVFGVILYRHRDTLYRFCQFPFPFIMCHRCEYPCFFKAAHLQETIAVGAAMSGLVGGRVFCGAACPVGTVQDWLQSFKRRTFSLFHYFVQLVFQSKVSTSKDSVGKVRKSEGVLGRGLRLLKILGRMLRLLKYPLFLIVFFYALARFAMIYGFMPDWGFIPALNFIMQVREIAGTRYINFWLFFLVIVLGIGLIWHRPWCKYLCPAGLLFAVFNKISFLRVKLARKGNAKCRERMKNCTTGKPLNELEKGFNSIECVRCYGCVLNCPEGEVKIAPRWMGFTKKPVGSRKPL